MPGLQDMRRVRSSLAEHGPGLPLIATDDFHPAEERVTTRRLSSGQKEAWWNNFRQPLRPCEGQH